MKTAKKYTVLFIIGGVGYALIELMWRRRTHLSMVLAGGICFMLFSVIAKQLKSYPLYLKVIISALAVTLVELIFGIVFNIMLNMNVWDYSDQPLNFLGQICPVFTLMWAVLGLIFLPIADIINRRFEH